MLTTLREAKGARGGWRHSRRREQPASPHRSCAYDERHMYISQPLSGGRMCAAASALPCTVDPGHRGTAAANVIAFTAPHVRIGDDPAYTRFLVEEPIARAPSSTLRTTHQRSGMIVKRQLTQATTNASGRPHARTAIAQL